MFLSRLRAVSLFSWSVEQKARDTQMTMRVTEGARRVSSRAGSRLPRFSRLAASPLYARGGVHSPQKIWRKRETARSLIFVRFSKDNATSNENVKARGRDWTRLPVVNFQLSHWSIRLLDPGKPASLSWRCHLRPCVQGGRVTLMLGLP